MKKILALLLITAASFNINAQVYVNPGVDTTDKDIKEVIEFYTSYVNEFIGNKLPDFTKYWSAENCKNYKIPDPSVYGINSETSTYSITSNKTIYYAKPLHDGTILLKSIGGWTDSLKNINIMYDVNIFITKAANQKYLFLTPIEYYNKDWQKQKVRNVQFIFQKNHQFDKKKADSLIKQIKNLEAEWNLKPIEIEYLFTNTYDEIQLIRGFNYSIGLGNRDKTSGISNDVDNIIYSAGAGENHFHEFVHVYLNKLFPKSPLKEGLAVFYGGSLGKPIDWHTEKLKNYLNNHKEINLNNLDDFWFMDNFTNPESTIKGILCNIAYRRDGIKGLKRIMTYESMNEIFEKEFKLDLKNLDQELRNLINNQ